MKVRYCSSCGIEFSEKSTVYMDSRRQIALCERCWTKEIEADKKNRSGKKEVCSGR